MTASKQQITKKMEALNMAWSVRDDKYISPEDGFEAKPTYHIHPDQSDPQQTAIKRFSNLVELNDYVEVMGQAEKAKQDYLEQFFPSDLDNVPFYSQEQVYQIHEDANLAASNVMEDYS